MSRIAAALLLAAACAPAAPATLTDADRQAIEAQRQVFKEAAEAADWTRLVALYTEDARVLPPNGRMVTGRIALRELFSSFPPIGNFVLATQEVHGGGDLAIVRGTYSMTLMPPGAPAAIADTGKFVEMWQKQPDGTWLIALDIWNSDIPLPAPPPPAGN